MKRQTTISLILGMSMLLSLLSLPSTTSAQAGRRPVADTGVVSLGPNQVLRVTGDWNGDGSDTIQFRQLSYATVGCSDGVCKHMVASQSTSAPVMLMPGEAASLELLSYGWGVRAVVYSEHPNVHVNATIVDTTTGNIIGVLMPL
jgi:hypothetical protein